MFPSLYAINTLQKICFVRSESTIDIRGFKIPISNHLKDDRIYRGPPVLHIS